MKKDFFSPKKYFLFCILFTLTSFGQEEKPFIFKKPSVTPYLGFISQDPITKVGFLYQPGDATLLGSPFGFGLRLENRFSDRFEFRLDFNYTLLGYKHERTREVTVNGNVETQQTNYRKMSQKFRAMIGFNRYFVVRRGIEMYFSMGVGYKNVRRWQVENGIGSSVELSLFGDIASTFSDHLAVKLGIGAQFPAGDHFSITTEVNAFGGPPFQLGFKWHLRE